MTIISSSTSLVTKRIIIEKEWTLDDIFTHPDFRLLYVPPPNEQRNMTIITPSKHDLATLRTRDFYALSHYWGNIEKDDNLWDVSDFITDEEGVLVKRIRMRKEKRKPLLSLLQANPGYWWIDVLCCRQKTPPIIMRGVYGCCKECFAMVDCPTSAIEYMKGTFNLDHLQDLFYPQGHYVDPAKKKNYLKEAFLNAYEVYDARWFTRVWTLQEATLPLYVILLSETCDTYAESKTIKIRSLLHRYRQIIRCARVLEDNIYSELPCSSCGSPRSPYDFTDLISINQSIRDLRNSINYPLNDSMRTLAFIRIFTGLSQCRRSCFRPEDYVHGVSGILGWDIPRLDKLDAVWDEFISFLKDFAKMVHGDLDKHSQKNIQISVSEKALSFSLAEALDLGDVYRDLLDIKFHCSCITCQVLKHMVKFDE